MTTEDCECLLAGDVIKDQHWRLLRPDQHWRPPGLGLSRGFMSQRVPGYYSLCFGVFLEEGASKKNLKSLRVQIYPNPSPSALLAPEIPEIRDIRS